MAINEDAIRQARRMSSDIRGPLPSSRSAAQVAAVRPPAAGRRSCRAPDAILERRGTDSACLDARRLGSHPVERVATRGGKTDVHVVRMR